MVPVACLATTKTGNLRPATFLKCIGLCGRRVSLSSRAVSSQTQSLLLPMST